MRELIVYKRNLKTGVFFYSRFMNQKTKKYDTSFSIEKLKSLLGYETSKRTRSRGEAFRIALAAIDAGIIETAKKKEKSPELAKYVLSFWDYDNSEYIRMKNLVKPNSVGPDYANNMVGTFKKNLGLKSVVSNKINRYVDDADLISLIKAIGECNVL